MMVGSVLLAGSLVLTGGMLPAAAIAQGISADDDATSAATGQSDAAGSATAPDESTDSAETTEQPDATEPTDTTGPTDTTNQADTTNQLDATDQADTTDQTDTTNQLDATDQLDTTNPADTTDQLDTTDQTASDLLAGSDWPEGGYLRGAVTATFSLSRLALTDGAQVATSWRTSAVPPSLAETPPGEVHTAFRTWGTFGGYDQDTGVGTKVVYRIAMLGEATPYWIQTQVWVERSKAWGDCAIYESDPRTPGAQPASKAHFNCTPHTTNNNVVSANGGEVRFDLSLNRWVEVSGAISTQGPVSLTAGYFESDRLPYHVHGTPEVARNGHTAFSAVVREDDSPAVYNLARTRFSYRIVDGGTPTNFWVAGWAQNKRASSFEGLQQCHIYDRDPVSGSSVPLEQVPTVKVSPYDCESTGGAVEDRGHWAATFTVLRRTMVTADAKEAAFELRDRINRVCSARPDDCGVTIATVTDFTGPGRKISPVFDNTSTTEMYTPEIDMSSTESYTNSGGFEIDITVGTANPGGIGPKFETTLKVHYERSVTTSSTFTIKLPVPVPPNSRGWMEAAPRMVRTQGTVIVLDNGVYYEMTNVDATFSRGNTEWETVPKSEPLVHGGVGGVEPDQPGGTPAVLVPGLAPGDTSANTRGSLAKTGVSSSPAAILLGITAFSIGGLMLVIARRRRRAS